MNRIFRIVTALMLAVCVVSFSASAAASYKGFRKASTFTNNSSGGPVDVSVVKLHTPNTESTYDTMATTVMVAYGPFPLSSSAGKGMYKSFSIFGDIVTGTGPTIAVDYQILPSLDVADTTATWTSACTLGVTASALAVNSLVDLSSVNGKGIIFRTNNYDAQAGQIPGKLYVFFRENFSYIMKQ